MELAGIRAISCKKGCSMDINIINRRLVETHGKDFLEQPIYRVVWSEDEIEKRFGTFRDYLSGTNILIREVTEVREVKKYPYLPNQYVLEKLFINKHNTEILDNKTYTPRACTYEPLWSFGHERNGRAKRPVWRAIELLILSINNPSKLTPSEMDDRELEQAYKDEQLMTEILNTHIKHDSLHAAIKDGGTVMLNQDYKNG